MEQRPDFGLMLLYAGIAWLFFATVYGTYLGIKRRAVFYMDSDDLMVSFAVLVAPLVVAMLLATVFSDEVIKWFLIVAYAAGIVYIYRRSYEYNKGSIFTGLVVGTAKIVLGVLYLGNLWQAWEPSGKTEREKMYKRAEALAMLAILTPLLKALINGKEVLALRQQEASKQQAEGKASFEQINDDRSAGDLKPCQLQQSDHEVNEVENNNCHVSAESP